jgi:phosphocarrier protein HPr
MGGDDDDCVEVAIPAGAVWRALEICNKKGLHARATAKFVQTASNFESRIHVGRCGETVDATSIMGILTLGAAMGSTITVYGEGPDAADAIEALAALVADKFGEGE